jgi:hypothetical protein
MFRLLYPCKGGLGTHWMGNEVDTKTGLVISGHIYISFPRWKTYPDSTVLLTYLLTYLITPWNRVLLEKLTGSQLVKKFPAFYETRKFVTAFTRVHLGRTKISVQVRDFLCEHFVQRYVFTVRSY